MARVFLTDPRIQNLVQQRLVPMFLACGNTAALCERLNGALEQQGETQRLYPNRLHTLLSAALGRSVQDKTVELVELACEAVGNDEEINSLAERERLRLLEGFRKEFGSSEHRDASVIEAHFGLPSAVVQDVLGPSASPPNFRSATASSPRTSGPDWSFQDVAIERTLRRLESNPTAKLGLIIPTGGGKTRIALRVALAYLASLPSSDSVILWVTHRKNLHEQARRVLQSMIAEGIVELPAEAAQLLARRIRFTMLAQLKSELETTRPRLVIVDEAHHAAAASYASLFTAPVTLGALFLTATPNRADELPIGIDEVVYTITFRELAERNCIVLPQFIDFPVVNFDWSPRQLQDLVDFILERSAEDFNKTLVIAPRIDRVEEFYNAIVDKLNTEAGHLLASEDVGFIHGTGNSQGIENGLFLDTFRAKPRAILVSAQLLLEGFDDPAIDSVILTTPSGSLVKLMQAAGRGVRSSPGKRDAFVVQPRNDKLAYHFDQRWLYQEISDYLRPELIDLRYRDLLDLRSQLARLLQRHHVPRANMEAVLSDLEHVRPGDHCRLFLSGLPYFGAIEQFSKSRWTAILETPQTSQFVRTIFNDFCAVGADIPEPSQFLAQRAKQLQLRTDQRDGTHWSSLMNLLTASYFAAQEIHRDGRLHPHGSRRPFHLNGPTTWLRYVTFEMDSGIPAALEAFLQPCENRSTIARDYLAAPNEYPFFLRLPLPMGRSWAYALRALERDAFLALLDEARKRLAGCSGPKQFSELAAFLTGVSVPLPAHLVQRVELVIEPQLFRDRTFELSPHLTRPLP